MSNGIPVMDKRNSFERINGELAPGRSFCVTQAVLQQLIDYHYNSFTRTPRIFYGGHGYDLAHKQIGPDRYSVWLENRAKEH